MSIINKMLQDLDRRQGRSDPDAPMAIPQLRTIPAKSKDREWFWRITALLLVASVGWVAWLAWQLQPRESLATLQALKVAQSAARNRLPAQPVAAQPAAPQTVAVQQPATQPPVVQPPLAAAAPSPGEPKPAAPSTAVVSKPVVQAAEGFKRAQEIETPIRAQPVKPSTPVTAKPAPAPVGATAAAPAPPPAKLSLDVPPQRILPAPMPARQQGPTHLEKRDRVRSPEQVAEAEFRRGVSLLNQGRVSEAEDLFAAALVTLPGHEAARQALVALHLEQRRIDEARRLLQEGVALHPGNPRFAAVLARILIERKDNAGALEVMNGIKAPVQGDAEIQSMRGAVLQRLGRHAEAAQAFQDAVRSEPQNGAAWIGLGLAFDALNRKPEAAEAFQRATATGTLGAEARAYAEQRARNLQ